AKEARFAPSVASVITAKDIKLSGAKTLDQALEMVPGLHVSASWNRQDAIYSIRGIHTGQNPQVLLLIDGIRVDQLFSGARPYNYSLPVANIERIEVIRGPGSALYGADAFAGVISVTTKTSQHPSGEEAGVSFGSFNTRETWLHSNGNLGDAKVAVSIQHVKTDGDDNRVVENKLATILPPASQVSGPLNTNHEIINSRVRISDDWGSFDLFSWHLSNAGNGSGGLQIPDPRGGDSIDFSGLKFDSRSLELDNGFKLKGYLSASVLKQDAEFYLTPKNLDPNFPDGMRGNPGGLQKNYEGEVNFTNENKVNHLLRFAAGFRNQKFTASESKNFNNDLTPSLINGLPNMDEVTGNPARVYISDEDREHYYLSFQDEWRFADDWELTAGLRYDSYTQFGESVNPRLALVWATAYNLTSKFLYGRAFRAPSLGELYSQHNPILVGNPELEPEVIDTYEVAFDYRPNYETDLKLNLFYYEAKDLIAVPYFLPASNSLEQTGYGFEVEMVWRPRNDLQFISNYAWHNTEDGASGDAIANAPQQQFTFQARHNISNDLSASAVLNWVADRDRAEYEVCAVMPPFDCYEDDRPSIDDYTILDLIINYNLPYEGLSMSLVGKNIFNEDAREPSPFESLDQSIVEGPEIKDDYPLEGRSINLEFTYQFDK
ncbi:MAG: TonB-dependent receptor, partial [Pseudomonadales bacterium]|nr:TonB-dependent receptor [Pseudomonadales bacterium]